MAGVSPSSIANPQSLMGLPKASHSRMSQCPHPSLAVYSQGQRGGFGLNIEGPLKHEFGPKFTQSALFFAAVHVCRILLTRTPLVLLRFCSHNKTFFNSIIHSFIHLFNKHCIAGTLLDMRAVSPRQAQTLGQHSLVGQPGKTTED